MSKADANPHKETMSNFARYAQHLLPPAPRLGPGDAEHLAALAEHLAALSELRDQILRDMGLRPEIIPAHLRPKLFERNP